MRRIYLFAVAMLAFAGLAAGGASIAAAEELPPLRLETYFGKVGVGEGEFVAPEAIAIDSEDNVWVADSYGDRVQEFNPNGKYLSEFGEYGSGNGQLSEPTAIDIDSEGNFWILDAGNLRVQKFNGAGKYLAQFEVEGYYPRGLGVDSKGHFFVGLPEPGCVIKFGTEEQNQVLAYNCEIESPKGIVLDSESNVWVGDAAEGRVVELNSATEALGELGELGEAEGQLWEPLGLAFDAEGSLWIADSGNRRVSGFTSEGKFLTQFGAEPDMIEPRDIAIDSEGNFWVVDTGYGRIEEWSYAYPPTASTGTASSVGGHVATANGTVNPKGEALSECSFEYGTTAGYGKTVACAESSGEIGSGKSPVAVHASLSGLTPGTTYHFRVVAVNSTGEGTGEDGTFTTVLPPTATTEAATGVSPHNASLHGSVNPHGLATTYQFEYGTTTSYGSKSPASPTSVGSGASPVAVSRSLGSLEGETTYHFRVVASSEAGETLGEDRTFTTPAAIPYAGIEVAYDIGFHRATLHAIVNPDGLATTYQFEYDTSTEYGSVIPASPKGIGSGLTYVDVSDAVTGLEPLTTYHFRVTATNAAGTVHSNDRVFETAPSFALFAGSPGSGNGRLDNPEAIDVDSEGNVWVADTADHQVEEFGPEGESLGQFGEEGTGNGQFLKPSGIAIDAEDNIWVADRVRQDVQEFGHEGEFLGSVDLSGYPVQGIALGTEGDFWGGFVSEWGCLFRWSTNLEEEGPYDLLCELGSEPPGGIAVDSEGYVWVTDPSGDRVLKLEPGNGPIAEFGESGHEDGQLESPQGLAFDPEGDIWVADNSSARVEAFTPAGEYLAKIPAAEQPVDVAVDPQGGIWVLGVAGTLEKFSLSWE